MTLTLAMIVFIDYRVQRPPLPSMLQSYRAVINIDVDQR